MNRQRWKCGDCGLIGDVEVTDFSDVWGLQNQVNIEHKEKAPDCKPSFNAAIFPEEEAEASLLDHVRA